MNDLSWLIYAAEVAGNVSALCGIVAIGGGMAIALLSGLLAVAAGCDDAPAGSWKVPLRYLWVVALAAVVATLIPSKNTIYMIAASEIGETVVTSPDAIEMMNDLKAIIKSKIKEQVGE